MLPGTDDEYDDCCRRVRGAACLAGDRRSRATILTTGRDAIIGFARPAGARNGQTHDRPTDRGHDHGRRNSGAMVVARKIAHATGSTSRSNNYFAGNAITCFAIRVDLP